MNKNKACYLFFDFDGTLTVVTTVILQNGKTEKRAILPDCHIDSLKKALALGHKIFLCTGRSRGSLLHMGDEFMKVLSIPWDGMIFGASDMWYQNKRIAVTYISREECLFWFNYCKDTKRIFCYNGTERRVSYDFTKALSANELDIMYSDLEIQLRNNPITNLSVVPAAHDLDMSKTDMTVVHLPTYSDAFPKGCNKGSAIINYCKLIGAPIEQTLCFGDSENDMDMFKVCSASVAMKKAPDALKSIATYSAKTDFGITEAISEIFGIE